MFSTPVLVLVISAVMWGVTWWPLQQFNQAGVAGAPLILVAYGVVAVALAPALWAQRRLWRGAEGYLLGMLLLGGWANLAFANAMIYGEVVRAMMLFYLAPVWGVLGGRLFLGERIDGPRWLGVVMALGGAFLVLGGAAVLAAPPSAMDLLAVSAGLAFALNNVTCRAAAHVPLTSKTAVMFIGCALMALLSLPLGAGLPPVGQEVWGGLLLFGLGWLLLATLTTQWAVTHMEAGRASVILITELLAALLSATAIGGESLAPTEWAGGALILAATVLEARRAGATTIVEQPVPS